MDVTTTQCLFFFFFIDKKTERAENRIVCSKSYKLLVIEPGIKCRSLGYYSNALVIALCYFISP